jgi:Lon protease-like protein
MSAVTSSRGFLSSGLPQILPIFPLAGVVLLPQARLPLNIFEPRYLAMIDHALGSGRIIGMIQPSTPQTSLSSTPPVYHVGCAGRITSFTETDDGRFLVALTGLCRFTVAEELAQDHPWRRVRPDWNSYLDDLKPLPEIQKNTIDRTRLVQALHPYFREEGITLDKNVVDNAPDDVLISSLVMMCPLPPSEKQALLEAPDLAARAKLLTALLEMACMPGHDEGEGGAKH